MAGYSISCPCCGASAFDISPKPGQSPSFRIQYEKMEAVPSPDGTVLKIICPGCGADTIIIERRR